MYEVNFYFYEKLKQKNAVVPTYPDFFRKKIRSKKKSSAYLPTLFDFRALAETKLFFYFALFEQLLLLQVMNGYFFHTHSNCHLVTDK